MPWRSSAGKHPVAQALRRLGAQSVTTTWLRRERPYAVMTEARFADLRQLAMAILRDAGAQGDVSLVRERLRDEVRRPGGRRLAPASAADPSAGNSALDALLTDLENYRFVLAEGRFTSADGFRILDEGTIAVWDEKKAAADGILTLALSLGGRGMRGETVSSFCTLATPFQLPMKAGRMVAVRLLALAGVLAVLPGCALVQRKAVGMVARHPRLQRRRLHARRRPGAGRPGDPVRPEAV